MMWMVGRKEKSISCVECWNVLRGKWVKMKTRTARRLFSPTLFRLERKLSQGKFVCEQRAQSTEPKTLYFFFSVRFSRPVCHVIYERAFSAIPNLALPLLRAPPSISRGRWARSLLAEKFQGLKKTNTNISAEQELQFHSNDTKRTSCKMFIYNFCLATNRW